MNVSIAATCGKWVILITCDLDDIFRNNLPTSVATFPLTPESISSKTIMGTDPFMKKVISLLAQF